MKIYCSLLFIIYENTYNKKKTGVKHVQFYITAVEQLKKVLITNKFEMPLLRSSRQLRLSFAG